MEAVLNVEALRANLRDDLRQKEALRPLHLEKESTYRADGSATVSQGGMRFRPISCRKDDCRNSSVWSQAYSNDKRGVFR